ncbi:unnamed protein product [Didymodactylos carnosus]|uniref:Alpha spectrin n=1 Tax=Didymodactylos carnosus TaxID=1234261 RepID=A0A814PQA2_9BILA|nr:unnamed protein product [Didymodactylos carnosus]CAF3873494.1 unnamed protein product [Didymodactylos carnosus]
MPKTVEIDPLDAREIQVLETAEDIQARRDQVLTHFQNFKDAAKYRREKLEDSREYQYFKRDADELEIWINEKLQICSQDGKALDEFGRQLLDNQHYSSDLIREKLDLLSKSRVLLLDKISEKRRMLQNTSNYFTFERDCDELKLWAKEKLKMALTKDYMDTLNINLKCQKHQQFLNELAAYQPKMDSVILN